MDWQITFTWLAVGLAAVYIGWRGSRILRSTKGGCAGGCGCAKAKAAETPPQGAMIPADQLVLRQKK